MHSCCERCDQPLGPICSAVTLCCLEMLNAERRTFKKSFAGCRECRQRKVKVRCYVHNPLKNVSDNFFSATKFIQYVDDVLGTSKTLDPAIGDLEGRLVLQ